MGEREFIPESERVAISIRATKERVDKALARIDKLMPSATTQEKQIDLSRRKSALTKVMTNVERARDLIEFNTLVAPLNKHLSIFSEDWAAEIAEIEEKEEESNT